MNQNQIKNKIINKAELAQLLEISNDALSCKINKNNNNKFTEENIKKLKEIIEKFITEFRSET